MPDQPLIQKMYQSITLQVFHKSLRIKPLFIWMKSAGMQLLLLEAGADGILIHSEKDPAICDFVGRLG